MTLQKKFLISPNIHDHTLTQIVKGNDQDNKHIVTKVIKEEALTIFLNNQEIVTLMCIIDYPKYLAIGYLLNQNMINNSEKIKSINYDKELGVIVVRTDQKTNYEKILKKKTTTSYFNKPFIRPARGRISSSFGDYRIYNEGSTSRKHNGTDIANIINTPIYATNSGKIILSKTLEVHGNTIMIDHGYGILTIYNHLNKRLVPENAYVKRGQKIGLMGKTGMATGSHLHWGLSVQNIRVNPLFWLESLSLYQ